MSSGQGISTAGGQRPFLHFPANKLLLSDRNRKRRLANGDNIQPLLIGTIGSSDETDRLPRKLRVRFYSVVFAIFSGLSYLLDFGTDIFVGVTQLVHCHYAVGILVLTLTLIPSVFVNTLGYLWIIDDLKRLPKNRVTNRLKKPVWIVGLVTQTIPALYCFETASYCLTFRRLLSENNGAVDARILELYYWILESDRDSTLLRVFMAFMESGPQLLIQAYLLCRHLLPGGGNSPYSLYAWAHYVSISVSLFGLSWSLMSQQRCVRYVRQDKENLSVKQCIMIVIWRTFTLAGRLIVLLWFALTFGYWLAALLLAHYLITFIILYYWEKPKLADPCTEQLLLLLGVAWVHLFCPWNVADGPTRFRYLWRYGLEFVELAVVFLLLFLIGRTYSGFPGYLEHAIATACTCYLVGMVVMCVYYAHCHPNLVSPQRKSPPLVVVYTPSEKVSISSTDTSDHVGTVTGGERIIGRGRSTYSLEEDDDIVCCCSGTARISGPDHVHPNDSAHETETIDCNRQVDVGLEPAGESVCAGGGLDHGRGGSDSSSDGLHSGGDGDGIGGGGNTGVGSHDERSGRDSGSTGLMG